MRNFLKLKQFYLVFIWLVSISFILPTNLVFNILTISAQEEVPQENTQEIPATEPAPTEIDQTPSQEITQPQFIEPTQSEPESGVYLTHVFDSEVNAFVIEGNFLDKRDLVSMSINFTDETTQFYEHIEESHERSGEEAVPNNYFYSQIYYFETTIASVEIFYSGVDSLDIKVTQLNTNTVLDNFTRPSALSSKASYAKSAYQNLGMNVIVREEWGVPQDDLGILIADYVNVIVVHHTAMNMPNDPKAEVKLIHDEHASRCVSNIGHAPTSCTWEQTWGDIGYNFIIDQHGNIYEGRSGGIGVVGAHSPPNWGTLGISLLGNFENQQPTQAAINSLQNLIATLSNYYNITPSWGSTVVGHRNRNSTACPGANLYNQMPTVTSNANARKPNYQNTKLIGEKASLMVSNQNVIRPTDDTVQMVVDLSTIDNQLKDWILNESHYTSNFKEVKGLLTFEVLSSDVGNIIRDVLLRNSNAAVQPDFIYFLTSWDNTSSTRAIPSDYNATTHWNLEKIKMPEAWKDLGGCASDNTCGGSPSVTVAVLDTGVAYENYNFDAGATYTLTNYSGLNIEKPSGSPDGQYNEGYDRTYTRSPELGNTQFTAEGYDAAWDFLCTLRNDCTATELSKIDHANDDHGHGTFVTTIIAGDTSDAASNQVVGMAHNVTIMPVKVFLPNDSSMCYTSSGANDPSCLPANEQYSLRSVSSSTILVWAIDYAVANGADVINMSLTGPGSDLALQSAINDATAAGVTVVVAAGNENDNIANYFPAGMENVISVGATDPDDTRTSYSNFGSNLDISAPVGNGIASQWFSCSAGDTCFQESGGNLLTTYTSSDTPATAAGTSFAAPQITAMIALMKSSKPNIQNFEIENILFSTAIDVGVAGKDFDTGYGIVDVDRALNMVWSDFTNNTTELFRGEVEMELYNGNLFEAARGTDNKIYTRAFDGASWGSFTVSSLEINSNIDMEVYDSKLYQVVAGADTRIYTRYFDGVSWSSFTDIGGRTPGNIEIEVYDNKLYLVVRGSDDRIYWRYLNGSVWSDYVHNGGRIPGNVELEVYSNRLYLAVRGTDDRIYWRYLDGSVWSDFTHNGGRIPEDIELKVYDNKMFMVVRGTDDRVYWRYLDGSNWSDFVYNGGAIVGNAELETFDNKLYMSVIGTDNRIYVRNYNGTTWTQYVYVGGSVGDHTGIESMVYNNRFYQAVIGRNDKIYDRNLIN